VKSFLQRFGPLVSGILHGFDRMRFRGSKRLLCTPGGFFNYLQQIKVTLWDGQTVKNGMALAIGPLGA
jgi:hypothetical protein